jgi:hypothetical protein
MTAAKSMHFARVFISFSLIVHPPIGVELGGFPQIAEGDIIYTGDENIWLGGIGAPKFGQLCFDWLAKSWSYRADEDQRSYLCCYCSKVFGRANFDYCGRRLCSRTVEGKHVASWRVRSSGGLTPRQYSLTCIRDGDHPPISFFNPPTIGREIIMASFDLEQLKIDRHLSGRPHKITGIMPLDQPAGEPESSAVASFLNDHADELQLGVDPGSLALVQAADTPIRNIYRSLASG